MKLIEISLRLRLCGIFVMQDFREVAADHEQLRKALAPLDRDTALSILRGLLAENAAGDITTGGTGVNCNPERNLRRRGKGKRGGKRQARLGEEFTFGFDLRGCGPVSVPPTC